MNITPPKWTEEEKICMRSMVYYFNANTNTYSALLFSYLLFTGFFPDRSFEGYLRAMRRYLRSEAGAAEWNVKLSKPAFDAIVARAQTELSPEDNRQFHFLLKKYLLDHRDTETTPAQADKVQASSSTPAPIAPKAMPVPVAVMTSEPKAQAATAEPENIFDSLKAMQKPYDRPFSAKNDTTEAEPALKILTLSDIHFPFARIDCLEQAILDNLDADILVLNGDIVEAYAFSKYSKSKSVSAMDEYILAFNFIEYCSKIFPEVYLTDGNHEDRVSRHLSHNGIHRDTTAFYGKSMLARIANGERLKPDGSLAEHVKFTNVHYDATASWYVKIGKTIFAHPHARGSGVACAQLKKAGDYFLSFFGHEEIDCVVIGHTHKQSKIALAHLLLIEQGSFAAPASYAFGPDMNFTGGTQNGYAVIYQDEEGNCIRNISDFYTFGTATPLK